MRGVSVAEALADSVGLPLARRLRGLPPGASVVGLVVPS